MNNLDETKLGELLRAMAKTNMGAIPDAMVYWSQAIDKNDPWANAEKDTWEMKVDFHD